MSSYDVDKTTDSAKGWHAISLGIIVMLVISNLVTAWFAAGKHAQSENWKQRWNADTTELAREIKHLAEMLAQATAEEAKAQNTIKTFEEALPESVP